MLGYASYQTESGQDPELPTQNAPGLQAHQADDTTDHAIAHVRESLAGPWLVCFLIYPNIVDYCNRGEPFSTPFINFPYGEAEQLASIRL